MAQGDWKRGTLRHWQAMTQTGWRHQGRGRWRRWMLMSRALVHQAVALELGATAASLSFLSLVAIVPIASIALLVLASVPAFAEWRERVQAFIASNLLLPPVADAVAVHVNQFAGAAGQLSLVSLVLFLATAFSTLLTIEHTLNRIWRTTRPRTLMHRLASYWLAMTAGPLVLAGLVALNVGVDEAFSRIGWRLDVHAPSWLPWLPWMFTTLLLVLLYRVVPNRPVRLRDAFLGAASAALLLEGLKRLMSLYIAAFPTYQIVYGAFSVLPVFLIWLYALWLAVLIGALIAANAGFAETDTVLIRGPRDEFARARAIVEAVAARPAGEPLVVSELAAMFGHSSPAAERVGASLAQLGYIVRVWPVAAGAPRAQVWREHWLAAPHLSRRSLRPLYEQVWRLGRLWPGRHADDHGEDGLSPDDDVLDAPLAMASDLPPATLVDLRD